MKKKVFVVVGLLLGLGVFALGDARAKTEEFVDIVYSQVFGSDAAVLIYEANVLRVEQDDSLDEFEKNYLMAQNLFLIGKVYQLFKDPETVVEHNRAMRKGTTLGLKKFYTDIDLIIGYYERALDLLNANIKARTNDEDYCLKSAVLGELCLIKNMFFIIANGPSIGKLADKALEINPDNVTAKIINAAAMAYPTKTWGGRPEGATEILLPMLDEDLSKYRKSDLFDIYTGLGYSYARIGDYEKADLYMAKALRIFPKNNYALGINQIIKGREL